MSFIRSKSTGSQRPGKRERVFDSDSEGTTAQLVRPLPTKPAVLSARLRHFERTTVLRFLNRAKV